MKKSLLTAIIVGLAAAAAFAEPSPALPPGTRAVALQLDALKCRYVDAGDRVDVLLTYKTEKGWGTATILQDIPVLAVKPLPGGQAELSLAVANKGADAYALAVKKRGTFTVAARAPSDHSVLTLETASFFKLFR